MNLHFDWIEFSWFVAVHGPSKLIMVSLLQCVHTMTICIVAKRIWNLSAHTENTPDLACDLFPTRKINKGRGCFLSVHYLVMLLNWNLHVSRCTENDVMFAPMHKIYITF